MHTIIKEQVVRKFLQTDYCLELLIKINYFSLVGYNILQEKETLQEWFSEQALIAVVHQVIQACSMLFWLAHREVANPGRAHEEELFMNCMC